jgi:hypothetical protein
MPGDVIQGHRYSVAVAKQSAQGTPATVADYTIPASAIDLLPRETREDFESLDGNAYNPGQFKSRADGSGSIDFFSFPDSIGRLVTASLGSDTVTGGSDPWTHTMVSNNTPQWLTIWVNRPLAGASNEWDRYADCLIRAVDLQWASGKLLMTHCEILAMKARTKATAPTGGVTNVLNATANKYIWSAPTLKMDFAATPAVTPIDNLTSFVLHFGYDNASFEQTDQLTPSYRDLGRWNVSLSADFLIQDWAAYYATNFGALAPAANTDQSQLVLSGSLDFLIGTDPVNANRTLQAQVPAMEFSITPPPPDPSGKGLRASLTGKLEKPASGQPLTIIAKNAVSAAN